MANDKHQDIAEINAAYELHKMRIIRLIEDWVVWQRSGGSARGTLPRIAQSTFMGQMSGEKAAASRSGRDKQKHVVFICNDCDRVLARVLEKCTCGNTRKGRGFSARRAESIAGKAVYASMISSTAHQRNYNAEMAFDEVMKSMPGELQLVIHHNYLWDKTQEEAADKIGVTVKQFRTLLHRAIDFLVGRYYEENDLFIKNP